MKFKMPLGALIPLMAMAMLSTQKAAAQTTVLADEVAAIVGNNTILLSDIEKQATYVVMSRKERGTLSKQTPKQEAFELLLMQNVLSQRARLDSIDKEMPPIDSYVEQEIQAMIEAAGGIGKLEKINGKPIYQIRADIMRMIQNVELAKMMQNKIKRRATINYEEVERYASKIPVDSLPKIPVQYSFSKIVKLPPQTEERKYAIRERLLEYRKRAMEGEKFSVLARLYSMDIATATMGGEMGPMSKSGLLGAFTDACEGLKPGQVSEIAVTEYGQHIIEMISMNGDMIHCRHILLKPEFTVVETERVIKELDSVATEIRAGRLDFKSAVTQFSDDTESRENGGKSFNTRPYQETGDIRQASSRYMPDQLMPAEYQQIRDMKVGDVSNSYETMDSKGNLVRQIIRLDEVIAPHSANIKQDYDVIQNMVLGEKQTTEFDKWANKTIEDMFIEISPAFKQYNFVRKAFDKKKK